MSGYKFGSAAGVFRAVALSGTFALATMVGPFALAKDHEQAGAHHKFASVKIEAPTRVIGLHGNVRLNVFGVHADGSKERLKGKDVTLHVSPSRIAKVLPNHTLHIDRKGAFRVYATMGKVKSNVLHLEAVAH